MKPTSAPKFWNARGRAYADLGKWDEAAADFARLPDLGPAAPHPGVALHLVDSATASTTRCSATPKCSTA